jgi:hypothetical protein
VGCGAATGGAVFFAAIVFAGFLAALRAAGLVPAAFFFAAPARFAVALVRFAAERAVFSGARLRAAARFFAAGCLAAGRRPFAAALRTGRLLLAALLLAFARVRLAAVRGAERLAAFVAGFLAALRAERFTDFLAADFFLAAMLASTCEEPGCSG